MAALTSPPGDCVTDYDTDEETDELLDKQYTAPGDLGELSESALEDDAKVTMVTRQGPQHTNAIMGTLFFIPGQCISMFALRVSHVSILNDRSSNQRIESTPDVCTHVYLTLMYISWLTQL